MRHLTPINQKARRIEATIENDVVALQQGGRAADRAARPTRLLVRVFAGVGGGQQRRHRGALPAGGARSVRLPPHVLLAGARTRSVQLRSGLDGEVRVRAEGLAQDRSRLPMRSPHETRDLPRRGARRHFAARAPRPVRQANVGRGRIPFPRAGTARIYVGTYARNILVLDEATMSVRDTMHTTVGIPEISLSFDRKHLYVSDPGNEKVEIIDLATKQSLGMFTLSHDSMKVRMNGFSLDPMERFAMHAGQDVHEEARPVRGERADAAPLRSREARRHGHDSLAAAARSANSRRSSSRPRAT